MTTRASRNFVRGHLAIIMIIVSAASLHLCQDRRRQLIQTVILIALTSDTDTKQARSMRFYPNSKKLALF